MENLKNMFGFNNGKLITISLNGGDPITYESITKASKETGIPIKELYRCKGKANLVRPVTFSKDGDVYTLSFEYFVDKVCIPSDRPKRLGKPITLYVDGIKPITYETMTKAAKELGISVQTLRYH